MEPASGRIGRHLYRSRSIWLRQIYSRSLSSGLLVAWQEQVVSPKPCLFRTASTSLRRQTRVQTSERGRGEKSPLDLQEEKKANHFNPDQIQKLADTILKHPSIPTDTETLHVLRSIKTAVQQLLDTQDTPSPRSTNADGTPASALLSLDAKPVCQHFSPSINEAVKFLSHIAHEIVLHPPVFITRAILATYVDIQSTLQQASTFPEVFSLYAEKPAPSISKSPNSPSARIIYSRPNPKAISVAVPSDLADRALETAIITRDLSCALSIIQTTYRTSAFRRAKLFSHALPPIVGVSLAPVAAYALASQLASQQTYLDPSQFTTIAFAGMFTYLATVGTIGTVALTTANDQMDRVTWAVGMPLRERWIREEERAAIDRVANAWGFKEILRRGEEEGKEWQRLKDWIGVRGMVLDKVGLMPGME